MCLGRVAAGLGIPRAVESRPVVAFLALLVANGLAPQAQGQQPENVNTTPAEVLWQFETGG